MVSGRDERAIDIQFSGGLKIVEGITHDENLGGRNPQAPDEIATECDLAVGVNIIEASDVLEVSGQTKVGNDFFQRLMPVGRKNRLAEAGLFDRFEDG